MRLKLTWLEILVIAATVAVLIAILLPNEFDNDRSHRYPSTVVPGISLGHVAGDYHREHGRGPGWNLSLLSDGRYSFVWSGCVGVLHRESGQAREIAGLIVLTPEIPNDRKVDRVLLPVRWDERSYLIPPEQISRFCSAILAGSEPYREIRAEFYLSNPSGRAEGLPDLPAKWIEYLRKRLVIGSILEVRQDNRVRIDLGAKLGLRVNDLLRLQGERYPDDLRVVAVQDETCVAELLTPGNETGALMPGRNVVFARPERPGLDQ